MKFLDKKYLFYAVNGVLVVAMIVLGYMLYLKNSGTEELVSQNDTESKVSQESNVSGENLEGRNDLSEEEEEVLNTPAMDASEEEKQQHFELVQQFATETEYLEIGECRATPLVFVAEYDSTMRVKNSSNEDRVMIFNRDMQFEIPANSTLDIKTNEENFEHGSGLYGYGCDLFQKAVGLILFTSS